MPQLISLDKPDNFYSVKCGLASFIATYIAGVLHPLDLIKTRFQSHDGQKFSENIVPQYTSVRNALYKIYINEGLKGLYKGFYVSLFSQATATAFFFQMYERLKKYYESKQYEQMQSVIRASIFASLVATTVTQPFWVIKTRMLLNIQPNISQIQNFKQKTQQIYQQNGLRGYTMGMSLSLILCLSLVIQMIIYESSRTVYELLNIPQSQFMEKNFICGCISKIMSVFVSYPLTTIRTRIQQNQYFKNRQTAKYVSIRAIFIRTAKDEGIRGFYKGMVANLLKGTPQRGIYFYFYQVFKYLLIDNNSEQH